MSICIMSTGLPRLASFPGSPSFRAIIPRMTFDPPEGKAEGEPGRFCHMTSVMLRHPYIRYRRGRTRPRLCLCTLCIVGIAETKNLCVDCSSPSVRVRSSNGYRACEIPSSETGTMEEQAGRGRGAMPCAMNRHPWILWA